MTFTFTFDQPTLFLVLYQHVSKKPSVINKYSKIPTRTIYNYIDQIGKNKNILERQQGQGRPTTISEGVRKKVVRTAKRRSNSVTTRSLGADYGVNRTSVDQILRESSFNYGPPKVTKILSMDQKNSRMRFCRDMKSYNGRKLQRTFFSDEMGKNLSDCYKHSVWNPPGKQFKVDRPNKDVRINVWGAISARGATSLHLYKGSLKADRYQEILEEHKQEMDRLYPEGYFFQHDNLSVHTAVEAPLRGQGLDILPFPAYSPDLSPIENLWAVLKNRVDKDNPRTEDALCKSLRRNWEELTKPETLRKYFVNLHVRYEECIKQKGERLNH